MPDTSMAKSQGGNLFNNRVEPMICSTTANSNHNAPHVGDSLESLGLGGDEVCLGPPSGTVAVNINIMNTFKVGDIYDSREILFDFAKIFSHSNLFTVRKSGKI